MNLYNSSININTASPKHVHELGGSTKLSEHHNHRFACITSEAIVVGQNHFHIIKTNTDFHENHHHEIESRTSLESMLETIDMFIL